MDPPPPPAEPQCTDATAGSRETLTQSSLGIESRRTTEWRRYYMYIRSVAVIIICMQHESENLFKNCL